MGNQQESLGVQVSLSLRWHQTLSASASLGLMGHQQKHYIQGEDA